MVDNDAPWWSTWDLSYTANDFGAIYGGGSVQEAFYTTLQTWWPTYVAEVNRKLGAEILEVPVEYRFRPDYRTLPREASAAILVTVPGTAGRPETYQAGVRAQWTVDVIIFVYGTQDWQETQALTYAYAACLRALILQQRDLGGFAQNTVWESEKYLEGEHSGTRTTGVANLNFTVSLGNVTDVYGGPPEPQFTPPGNPTGPTTLPLVTQPEVATVDLTIIKEPLT